MFSITEVLLLIEAPKKDLPSGKEDCQLENDGWRCFGEGLERVEDLKN